MALANWARMTTTSTGTGNLTLVAVTGYPTINNVIGVDRRFAYVIELDSDGTPIEAGIGYLSTTSTLVRMRVTATYTGGVYDDTSPAALNLTAGTYRVISAGTADVVQGAALNVNRNASIAAQKLIPSQHMTVNNASSTGYTCVLNRMVYMPFELCTSAEVDALGVRVGTAGAASSIRLGVYDVGADGHPNKLLGETGALASATTGVDVIGTLGAPVRLQPGWYYVAVVSNGTPALGRIDVGGVMSGFLGASSANLMTTMSYFYATHAFGALPTAAATTSLTVVNAGTAGPTILMRMV